MSDTINKQGLITTVARYTGLNDQDQSVMYFVMDLDDLCGAISEPGIFVELAGPQSKMSGDEFVRKNLLGRFIRNNANAIAKELSYMHQVTLDAKDVIEIAGLENTGLLGLFAKPGKDGNPTWVKVLTAPIYYPVKLIAVAVKAVVAGVKSLVGSVTGKGSYAAQKTVMHHDATNMSRSDLPVDEPGDRPENRADILQALDKFDEIPEESEEDKRPRSGSSSGM